jgi:hypothetical protein
MRGLLFGVSPLDPVAYLVMIDVMVLSGFLATHLPPRQGDVRRFGVGASGRRVANGDSRIGRRAAASGRAADVARAHHTPCRSLEFGACLARG